MCINQTIICMVKPILRSNCTSLPQLYTKLTSSNLRQPSSHLDRPEHHSTDPLKERVVEKGSGRYPTLRGRERCVFHQTISNFGTVPRTTLGALLSDWRAVYRSFLALRCHLEQLLLFVGCLMYQEHASVSQGRICSDNFTCCHTEVGAADQTLHLTQSQYTDTGPTSPSTDPITPVSWQGNHRSVEKNPGAIWILTRDLPLSRRTP